MLFRPLSEVSLYRLCISLCPTFEIYTIQAQGSVQVAVAVVSHGDAIKG